MARRHVVVRNSDLRARQESRSLLHQINNSRCLLVLLEGSKVLVDELRQLIVVHRTSSGNDHPVGLVVFIDVCTQCLWSHCCDVLRRSQDRFGEWSVLIGHLVQVIEHHFIGLLLHFVKLSKNYVLLTLHCLCVQRGVLQNVCEILDCSRDVLLHHPRKEDCVLPGGVCIHLHAQVLRLQLDLRLAHVLGAFKDEVLEKMCHAVVFGRLEPGSGVDVHPDRRNLRAVDSFGGYAHAIRKRGHQSRSLSRHSRCRFLHHHLLCHRSHCPCWPDYTMASQAPPEGSAPA
mmetsp:Transcript_6341/g.19169  ORF Transcript_6341/g.19169 Transcript_6341/m.19169 type:complete len:287 (-) Transcript_6341:119-979(-)